METLLFIVTLQALTTGLLIYLNKKFRGEDLFLSLFFGVFTVHLLYKILLHFYFHDSNIFEKLNGSFSLLYGPLLFFYTSQVLRKKVISFKVLLHCTPFLVCLGLNILAYISLLFETEISHLLDIYHTIISVFILSSLIGYSYLTYSMLKEQKPTIVNQTKKHIIQLIMSCLLVISLLIIVGNFLAFFDWRFNLRVVYYGILIIMFFGVIHLRTRLFLSTGQEAEFKVEKKVNAPIEKYKNSKIDTKLMEDIATKINSYLQEEKPYLNADFNLEDLSKYIDVPKVQITQTLNLHLNTNFYHLVNNARIELSKELIARGEEENLTVVGYESGFKSKSTFYKYFKEVTGSNPTDYRKQVSL
ncbi:helix-turn-helix domain-containing protein [Belliella sp. DSM 111904]|uniref:Helix-turn-helix domain-containing protein n=1 Tax=Belliella filtrata TaxID=2923435 RepID=A0ABS9UUL8_9BACT|nr:helix-turn-helix domain-containing protein [Belliella filtrata]MCH7407853.1 helix-turn-helix domain-containing protein [Belliella filtrata]